MTRTAGINESIHLELTHGIAMVVGVAVLQGRGCTQAEGVLDFL
jgi:hypothetical protein